MVAFLRRLLKEIKEIIFDEENITSSSPLSPQPLTQPSVVLINSNPTTVTHSRPVVVPANNLQKGNNILIFLLFFMDLIIVL